MLIVIMPSVIMLNVTCKPFVLSVVMLRVVRPQVGLTQVDYTEVGSSQVC